MRWGGKGIRVTKEWVDCCSDMKAASDSACMGNSYRESWPLICIPFGSPRLYDSCNPKWMCDWPRELIRISSESICDRMEDSIDSLLVMEWTVTLSYSIVHSLDPLDIYKIRLFRQPSACYRLYTHSFPQFFNFGHGNTEAQMFESFELFKSCIAENSQLLLWLDVQSDPNLRASDII